MSRRASAKHPAMMWTAFFKRLLGEKNASTYSTEDYVRAFSVTFGLKQAPYVLNGKRVLEIRNEHT